VRVNAEDPSQGFLPSPGTITRLRVPGGPGVRWDGGYAEGDTVSPKYDNLVGKLVVWGPDREAARARMLRALGEFEVTGIATTIPAHQALVAHPDFAAGEHSTKWVENDFPPDAFAEGTSSPAPAAPDAAEPLVERTVPVEVDGKRFSVKLWLPETPAGGGGTGRARSSRPRPGAAAAGGAAGSGTIVAPMQGTIVKVLVAPGDTVEAGQSLLVLEAMKMEQPIRAPHAGRVAELRAAAGQQVEAGVVLAVIEEEG
jgi:acetyl-CoA/propionyl-CoA carboxylase biotin carboxyl carrier protein